MYGQFKKTTYLCTCKQKNRMPMLNLTHYFPITDPTLIFFVVLLIVLFAPIIMGKLRIPHIIGFGTIAEPLLMV